ncbi:MAG: hypothetical protein ACN6ON_17935 [Sphingobacterium sp.]
MVFFIAYSLLIVAVSLLIYWRLFGYSLPFLGYFFGFSLVLVCHSFAISLLILWYNSNKAAEKYQ